MPVRTVSVPVDCTSGWLATASYDNTARLWDVRDPHHPSSLGTLTGHTDIILSVTFSSDGQSLATASKDTTARMWDINVERVTTTICSATPAIAKREWDHYLPGLVYRPACP